MLQTEWNCYKLRETATVLQLLQTGFFFATEVQKKDSRKYYTPFLNEFVVGAETTSSGNLFHLDITQLEKDIILA